MPAKLTTEVFKNRAIKIHNNKYDYSRVIYKNYRTKVIIICSQHGEFLQLAKVHLSGSGCMRCSGLEKLTTECFIEKANTIHNGKYDYSKVKYENIVSKIIVICTKHSEFLQRPKNHLEGYGCKYCADTTWTKDKFMKIGNKIHDNKYNYSKVEYKNYNIKVIIICPQHGQFLQSPDSHITKQSGCPKCTRRISKSSIKWLDKIEKQNNIKLKREFYLSINNKRVFVDGFSSKTNTCYEYYGNYWHGNPEFYNSNNINPHSKKTYGELYQRTLKRERLIKSAGYNLITKWGN